MKVLLGGNPMTQEEIAGLGPALVEYLGRFRGCFLRQSTAAHFNSYCRGLLSNLPRKSVEPIALESCTAVRTLQEFLVTSLWSYEDARDLVQRRLADIVADLPADDLGCVGIFDETSCQKWGDQTPGVQRQYLGCVGKIDNGIVTVHVGVAKGTFQALLDADLFLPEAWADDRRRCRRADIPDSVSYRSKWQLALEQYLRVRGTGMQFDWLVFDEYYGSKVPLLWVLAGLGQKYVAEVPVNFTVREGVGGSPHRADELQPAHVTPEWGRFRFSRKTVADQLWRATSRRIAVGQVEQVLITAVNDRTGEVKYFVSNAVNEPLGRLMRVAFRRAVIEHAFRLAKQEVGLMHYEGRHYTGLMRHLVLALVVLGFVAEHTERLRGEKSTGDSGAGVSSVEPTMCGRVSTLPGSTRVGTYGRRDSLSPGSQRASNEVTQETTV
jgi:SRSO17 transposase